MILLKHLNVIFLLIFNNFLYDTDAGGGGGSRYVNTMSYKGPKRTNVSIYEPVLDHIFGGYNPIAIPICKKGQPLHMTVDMWLYQLFDLDEPKQELTLDVWIDLNWHDCSISWDPHDFNNITQVTVPAHDIWHPDIFSYQGLHGNYEEGLFIFRESKVKIVYDGTIQLGAQLVYRTFCRVNIEKFPYDEQHCPITFSAWNKDSTVFNLTKKPKHDDDTGHSFVSASNGEWIVDSLSASDNMRSIHTGLDEEILEKFTEVTFTLKLKRKPLFIRVYLIFPCLLLLWLTTVTFVLPVESGDKITIVMTVLLALIVLLLILANNVPHTSDNIPIIGKFFFSCIALVTLAICFATIVLNMAHKHKDIAMPKFLQNFIYSNFAQFFCFSFTKPVKRIFTGHVFFKKEDSHLSDINEALTENSETPSHDNKWNQLSQILDRMFLILYIILSLINTLYILIIR